MSLSARLRMRLTLSHIRVLIAALIVVFTAAVAFVVAMPVSTLGASFNGDHISVYAYDASHTATTPPANFAAGEAAASQQASGVAGSSARGFVTVVATEDAANESIYVIDSARGTYVGPSGNIAQRLGGYVSIGRGTAGFLLMVSDDTSRAEHNQGRVLEVQISMKLRLAQQSWAYVFY